MLMPEYFVLEDFRVRFDGRKRVLSVNVRDSHDANILPLSLNRLVMLR